MCMPQADIAKLETSITLSGYRIELKMFGFSEKLPVLAQKIANNMKTLTSTQLEFEVRADILLNCFFRVMLMSKS